MTKWGCLLGLIFYFYVFNSFAQNGGRMGNSRLTLEVGLDIRNDWFLGYQFFPTSRLFVGMNNGKNSVGLTLYNDLVTFKYWGAGIKYMRYMDVPNKKLKLGVGLETVVTRGEFIYNEILNFDGAIPFLYNKFCVATNLCFDLGYKLDSKNMFFIYSGIGVAHSFNKIPYYYSDPTPKYEDKNTGLNFLMGISYRRLIKL